MRGGKEPYAGADDDARAIDTRIGTPSAVAERIDRAIRGSPRDIALLGVIVRHLASGLSDASLWTPIDEAGGKLAALETEARKVSERYKRIELSGVAKAKTLAFIDATASHGRYDKTLLLLIGQKRADAAVVLDRDTVTFAAPFDSGINFLALLGLSGGMPTLVSIPKSGMAEALRRLGVTPSEIPDIS